MFRKTNMLRNLLILILTLVLIVPTLAACGDDDDEETVVPTVAATTSKPATTPAALTTTPPAKKEPVKVGAVFSWSGAGGMAGLLFADPVIKLVQKQVEEQGGILGGRSIEFVKYDDKSELSQAVAGVVKFSTEKDISAVLFGGTSVPSIVACGEEAEKRHIPYFTYAITFPKDLELKYTVGVHADEYGKIRAVLDIAEKANAQSVGFLSMEGDATRQVIEAYVQEAENRGLDVVYNSYFPANTTDFSPMLTKIKYADPDVLIISPVRTDYITGMFKQMLDLGGWGNIKIISPHSATADAAGKPGSEGIIAWVPWLPGVDTPGGKQMEHDYQQMSGKLPMINFVYFYNATWAAIHAIELAGSTEREAIAKAAHSGNLQWETPAGSVTIPPRGLGSIGGFYAQVRDGKLVMIATVQKDGSLKYVE